MASSSAAQAPTKRRRRAPAVAGDLTLQDRSCSFFARMKDVAVHDCQLSGLSFRRGLFSLPHSCICQELKSVLCACRVPPPVDVVLQNRPKASVRT